MSRPWFCINLILSGLISSLLVSTGCQTPGGDTKQEEEKVEETKKDEAEDYALLRLHLQVPPDLYGRSVPISILRTSPVTLHVDPSPFLTEANLLEAELVETKGIYEIRLKFDLQGATILENVTLANKQGRIAILCKWSEQRWLSAYAIRGGIQGGILRFTPDADRSEAEEIVKRLKKTAEKLQEIQRI